MTTAKVRCAIYTRKSSEEGLDQAFNSLHAQRESCEAYVLSQAGEGWTALPTAYDDGGFSGGNIERPALQHLLADITAGKVDIVVVYKIDRLTRSLADFAKIVEKLDAAGASFVSVTQAFNTTTSMGRLTLNVLLSFAQFEREVTGERIRDKIAASKAKGMWMGGMISLGYDLVARELVVNPAEAETVRMIFRRYLEIGSVNELQRTLASEGVKTKAWISRTGKPLGGTALGRGGLFYILKNRLYRGEIRHGAIWHPGRHAPILDEALFEAVQQRLAANKVQASRRQTRAASLMLCGKVFDAAGAPMSPSFAYGKRGRLYRYYIAADLQVGRKPPADGIVRRISADALETRLLEHLRRLADRSDLGLADLKAIVTRVELGAEATHLLIDARPLTGEQNRRLALKALRASLGGGEQAEAEDNGDVRIVLPMRMQVRGGRAWIDGEDAASTSVKVDAGMVGALRSSHAELARLNVSPITAPEAFDDGAAPEGHHRRQLSRLPFLAPDLQRAILEGRQPRGLKLRTLLKSELPLLWSEQREWFARMHAEAGAGHA